MFKIAIVFALLSAAPAMAFDQAFLGTWAPDASSCGSADSTARFTVTRKKLAGREFACTLKHASKAGTAWRMQYSCVGEGEDYNISFKWRMAKNGHLLEQGQDGAKEYMRCDQGRAADSTKATTESSDFAGEYVGSKETYEWNSLIAHEDAESYSVHIAVNSSKWHCISEIDAVGRLRRGRIVTQPDSGGSCVLTISRTSAGIEVVEHDCSLDHGATCTFSSRMKKVGQ